jgi:hypothetical protein
MPRLRPFKALRYPATSGSPGLRLIDDPFAITDAQRRAWIRDESHLIHLLEAPNPDSVVRRWRDRGALVEDAEAAFHVLEVEPAGAKDSRRPAVRYLLGAMDPREGTQPLEEEPRPIAGGTALPAVAADDYFVLRRLLKEVSTRTPPELEVRSDGHLLRLWRVADPTTSLRIVQAVEEVDLRPLGPAPEHGSCLAAVLPLSDPGLEVRPLHRALKGLETFNAETFLTLVQAYARIYDLEAPLSTAEGLAEARDRMATLAAGYHAVLLVLPGGRGKILRFRQALELSHIKAVPKNPTLRSLDLALLNALVLRTVLGIPEPEQPGHPQVFQHPSLEGLVEQVGSGTFQVGFALNPPPLWQIRAVMEAKQQLPSRTFVLDPLPPAGLLFRSPEE